MSAVRTDYVFDVYEIFVVEVMSFFIYVSIYAQGMADTIDRFPFGLVWPDGCPFKDEIIPDATW